MDKDINKNTISNFVFLQWNRNDNSGRLSTELDNVSFKNFKFKHFHSKTIKLQVETNAPKIVKL